MKLSYLLAIAFIMGTSSIMSGASTAEETEHLYDCMLPLADFSKEEPDTETLVRDALAATESRSVLWKRAEGEQVAALILVEAGNDYRNLFTVSFDSSTGEFSSIAKFKYLFSRAGLTSAVRSAAFDTVEVKLVNPKSIEDRQTATYKVIETFKHLSQHANRCSKTKSF